MTTFSGGLSVKAIPKSCIGATQSLTYTYSTASMPPSPTLLPSLCRDDILAAVKEQKGLFEGATRPHIKAQESQKLLAMLFYTALPPGRAKEFQTLHVAIHDKLPMPVVDQARPNCLYITTDGRQAYLLLADYKTHKSYGDHFLPLDDDSQLLSHLVIHLSHHREVLLGAGQQTTALFLVSTRHTYNYIYMVHLCMYTPPPESPLSPSQCSCRSLTQFFLWYRTIGEHHTVPVRGLPTLRESLNATLRKRLAPLC